ncbi:unnamed protein product [Somion occarium]|uniref:DUF6593 domain-containing protein n=1 Tax=Somion occarium TaxID=3059160 RepID=A0ABP1D8E1_9APHY
MLKLELSSSSFVNTVITDHRGRPLYHLTTSTGMWKAGPTRIYRVGGGANGTGEIATITWRAYRSTQVNYRGFKMDMKTFMPKAGFWSGKRTLTGPDGTRYYWKKRWGKPADLKRESGNGRSAKRVMRIRKPFMSSRTYMEIDREAEHMLELIIVGAAFMERERLGADSDVDGGDADDGDADGGDADGGDYLAAMASTGYGGGY